MALTIPALIVTARALWLIPALDARVASILAGRLDLPRSGLHAAYIAVEAIKILALLGFGLGVGRPLASRCGPADA